MSGRTVRPDGEEAFAWCAEGGRVERRDCRKRNRGEIEHARGPLPPAVGPPADVAVHGDEAATLVEGLLLQDTVEADDPSSCAPERAVEQRAPDPAATQVRADDEKPDERVSLAIERARGGGRDSPTSRPSPITSASLSCTSTPGQAN